MAARDFPAPVRAFDFRVFYRGFGSAPQHLANTGHPEDAARIANAWGAGASVWYRGRCVAELAVNGHDCTDTVKDAAVAIDAAGSDPFGRYDLDLEE